MHSRNIEQAVKSRLPKRYPESKNGKENNLKSQRKEKVLYDENQVVKLCQKISHNNYNGCSGKYAESIL